jgi:hypothetical protein
MALPKKTATIKKKQTSATPLKPRVLRSSAKESSKSSIGKAGISSHQLSIPINFLEQLGLEGNIDEVKEFLTLKTDDKIKASRKIIQECVIDAEVPPDTRFGLAIKESESLLSGYSTLDDIHRSEIQTLINQITAYLNDTTRKRPFNALMLASPGAGKSHFIKQLANSMKDARVEAVTFNMATMQSAGDMAQPIDELRNLKVNDRFPLLFLDEFDSDPSRYAALLPLLWDGELQISHRDLKLGKAVIVLAGSNPDLPKAMIQSSQMRLEPEPGEGQFLTGKLIDLLSRINGGVINIPDLDLRTEHRDRRVDKVCVAVTLLKARYGNNLSSIPRSLLRFIAHTTFRYGVRSIAHLIDVIASEALVKGKFKVDSLGLPFGSEETLKESSLRLHLLDKDQAFGIVNRWKEFSKDKAVVSVNDSNALRYVTSMLISRYS